MILSSSSLSLSLAYSLVHMHTHPYIANGHQYDSRHGNHKAKYHHLRHADRYKVHPAGSDDADSQLLAGEVQPANQEGQDGGS